MTIQADLKNWQNWDLTYFRQEDVIYDAAGGYRPLPAFEIPLVFDKRILMIRANSTNAKFSWRFLGVLSQFISVDRNGSPRDAALYRTNLRINRSQILFFDRVDIEYELIFEPFYWLKRCELSIYTFTGEITDI